MIKLFTEITDQAAFKACWAGAVTCTGWLVGGFGKMLMALFILYLIDFALGFYRAWKSKNISRGKIYSGFCKVPLYALVIISAQMLDNIITVTVPDLPFLGGGVRGFIIGYAGIMEMLSICTHLNDLGVRLPISLVKRLRGYRDKMEGEST